MFLLQLYMYFAQRLIFEHSVSGIGNLPSHVKTKMRDIYCIF